MMNPPEFERTMKQLLHRLGLQPPVPPPQVYRLNFGDEPPVYCVSRPGGWLEMQGLAGHLPSAEAGPVATALLALQLRQGDGALHSIVLEKVSGKVSVHTRLRIPESHVDDLINAMQALRKHTADAREILQGRPPEPEQDNAKRHGSTLLRLRLRSAPIDVQAPQPNQG